MNLLYEVTCRDCKQEFVLGVHGEGKGNFSVPYLDHTTVFCPACGALLGKDHYTFKDLDSWQTAAEELLRNGQKTTAIKQVRKVTGMGLREAKEAVEALPAHKDLVDSIAGQTRTIIDGTEFEKRLKKAMQSAWGFEKAEGPPLHYTGDHDD